MRQIKFRGRLLRNDVWMHGSHYNDGGEEYILLNMIGSAINYENWQVDPNTVGQYTGLHDRKDREIYEGDVLFVKFSDGSGGNQLVGWNRETASWGVMSTYEYQSLKDGDDWPEFKSHTLFAFLKHTITCEVVGNIHDDPELMNVPGSKD